jgi:multiple antibiotic resistance protein
MIFFNFFGNFLFEAMGVTSYAVLVSGGIILFILSLKLIFPSRKDADVDAPPDKEPFIVPLAIPLVAGPGVLAAIMLYSRQEESSLATIGAIFIAWVISTLILLSSAYLKKILGWRGIIACERLMGLLLMLLAIQMFLSGITEYFSYLHAL